MRYLPFYCVCMYICTYVRMYVRMCEFTYVALLHMHICILRMHVWSECCMVLVFFKVTGLEPNELGVTRGIQVLVASTVRNLPQRKQHSLERTENTSEALWQLSFCKILVHTKICVYGVVCDIATGCFTWYFTGGVNCGKQIACVHT